MKKLISIFLIFCFSLVLIGCSNEQYIVDFDFDEHVSKDVKNGAMTVAELQEVKLFIDSLIIPNDLIQFYALSELSKINDDSFPYELQPEETNEYFLMNIFSLGLDDPDFDEYLETLLIQIDLGEMRIDELCNRQKQYLLIDDRTEHIIYKTKSNNFTYEIENIYGKRKFVIDLKSRTINQVTKSGNEFELYMDNLATNVSTDYIDDSSNYLKIDLYRNYKDNEISMLLKSVEDESNLKTSFLYGKLMLKYITEDLYLELIVGTTNLVDDQGLAMKSMGYILKYEFNNNNTFEKFEVRSSFDELATYDEFIDEILSIFSNVNEKYFIRNGLYSVTSEIYDEYLAYTWNYSFD